MLTTSTFAARFRFVVWTLSCLSAFPSSLYTFSADANTGGASLGVGMAPPIEAGAEAFTEFEKFYFKAE